MPEDYALQISVQLVILQNKVKIWDVRYPIKINQLDYKLQQIKQSYQININSMFCSCTGNKKAQQQQNQQSMESPIQIKLIQSLGLKSCIMDRFVFRRKPPTYRIQYNKGANFIFLAHQQYNPPSFYKHEVQILQSPGHSIPVLRLTPTVCKNNQNIPCIIYAHGNSSDLGSSLHFISKMVNHFKAQYIVFDYTGYGASRSQNVDQDIINKDLQIVLAWANRPLDKVILWGFSLGTCPVIFNAVNHKVRAVILQCPIGSLACMFYEQFSHNIKFKQDIFANINMIANIKSKILMMHSTKDEIIPVQQARLLYNKYVMENGDKTIDYIEVEKIKHNAFHQYIVADTSNDLQKEVLNFLKSITEKMSQIEQTQDSSLGSFSSLPQYSVADRIGKIRQSITTARFSEDDSDEYSCERLQNELRKDARVSTSYSWFCCQR